jgi:hypothetical protein
MRIFRGVGRNITLLHNKLFDRLKLLLEVEIPCLPLEELIYRYDKPPHQMRAAAVLAVD